MFVDVLVFTISVIRSVAKWSRTIQAYPFEKFKYEYLAKLLFRPGNVLSLIDIFCTHLAHKALLCESIGGIKRAIGHLNFEVAKILVILYRSFQHNKSYLFRFYVLFWYWQLGWEKSWDVKQFMVTITHKLCRNLPFTSVFFDTHISYWSTGLKNMSFQQEMLNIRKGQSGGKRHALELIWSPLLIAVPRFIFWWYI